MSREIKFRAWDVITNLGMSKPFGIGQQTIEFGVNGLVYEVTPDFVNHDFMQYTGLKDGEGVEIYEGDILRIPAKDNYEETTFNCFEVFYHDNECIGGQNIGFCMNRMHTHGNSAGGAGYRFTPESINKNGFIVIGNIYQTPELINEYP